MKKILGISLFLLMVFGVTFAQTLQLDVPNKNIDINNPFAVSITVSDAPQGGNVTLEGVDQFEVVGQNTATTMQIINGQRTQGSQLQLQLKAKETGTYVLGPARIQGNTTLESNSVEVEITGDKLFVNGTPQGRQQSTRSASDDVAGVLNEKPVWGEESLSQKFPRRIALILFVLLGGGGVLGAIKKKKAFEKILETHGGTGLDQDGFIELGMVPASEEENYYEKTCRWISIRIELQTGEEAIGKSPEQLKNIWKSHGYHGVDDEPILEILGLIEQGLYQGNESIKEDLYTLLQSL